MKNLKEIIKQFVDSSTPEEILAMLQEGHFPCYQTIKDQVLPRCGFNAEFLAQRLQVSIKQVTLLDMSEFKPSTSNLRRRDLVEDFELDQAANATLALAA